MSMITLAIPCYKVCKPQHSDDCGMHVIGLTYLTMVHSVGFGNAYLKTNIILMTTTPLSISSSKYFIKCLMCQLPFWIFMNLLLYLHVKFCATYQGEGENV